MEQERKHLTLPARQPSIEGGRTSERAGERTSCTLSPFLRMREDLLVPWLIPDFYSHPWTLFATIYLKVFFVHCAITETIRIESNLSIEGGSASEPPLSIVEALKGDLQAVHPVSENS